MANGPVLMPPWVAQGAKSSREFVSKLGIVGDDDFAAILVRDVQTGDDSGRLVPQKVKKAWQHWNLAGGNPDKGGDKDEHMAMYQEYEDFKEWFPKRFEHEKHERTVKQKERASDAEKAAIAARADSRLEEATEFATLAIAAYRAVHNWYTQEMQPTAMNQAAFDLRRAQELFDTIRQEAEEAENIRREKQIKDKESKAEIVRLADDTRKKDQKMQEMHTKIDGLTSQLCDAKHECTELQDKVRKLQNGNTELQTQWDKTIKQTSPKKAAGRHYIHPAFCLFLCAPCLFHLFVVRSLPVLPMLKLVLPAASPPLTQESALYREMGK